MISENSWIPWDERNDIPKLAFIITNEVIPMPPIPVEYVEDFEKEIETNRLWHTDDVTDVHCYPEKTFFMIVNYNALPKEVRMYYADYFDFNNEYVEKMVKSMLLHSKQNPSLLGGKSIDDYRKGLKDLLFHNYQYLCNIQKRLERFARAEWQSNQWVKSLTDSVSTVPVADVPAAPAVSDTPADPASAPADNDSPADKTAKPKTARKKKNCRITIDIGLEVLERRRNGEIQEDIASDMGFHYTQFQKNKILLAVEGLVKQEKDETKDWQTLAAAGGLYDDTTDIDNETFSDVPISQKPFRK